MEENSPSGEQPQSSENIKQYLYDLEQRMKILEKRAEQRFIEKKRRENEK